MHLVPAQTSHNHQQNAGASPQDGKETSQGTGSTEFSAANSPRDLNGHLVDSRHHLLYGCQL